MGCTFALASMVEFQSTHPCGVRQPAVAICLRHSSFNPRTPAGCDSLLIADRGCAGTFQSTHPCGVRPLLHHTRLHRLQSFNPRTPAGCDDTVVGIKEYIREFQSTHPCGVRRAGFRRLRSQPRVSIHAPLRGATDLGRRPRQLPGGFNPRTPAGCDFPACRGF